MTTAAALPFRIFFKTDAEAHSAAEDLRALGGRARRLLEECVETQGLTRTAISKACQQLEDEGFVFVRDNGTLYLAEYHLSPTLAGEEALELLDFLEAQAKAQPKVRPSRQSANLNQLN